MRRSHDQLFKELISAFPADFLQLVMPDLAVRVDLKAVHFYSPEHFLDTPQGRRRSPDLVATLTALDPSPETALAHIEVESRFRSAAAGRFLEYNRLLALRHGLKVHTAVLYLRGGPPGLHRQMFREVSFDREIHRFRYDSFGLSRASSPRFLRRKEPLAWAFAALMQPGSGSQAEHAVACLQRIVHASEIDEARRFLLVNCVNSYIQLDTENTRKYESLIRTPENQEIRDMMTSWADKLKAEGRREGMQDLVLRLVNERFGRPSQNIVRRIKAITSPQELVLLASKVQRVTSQQDLLPKGSSR